jgi:hypothetical protein
MGFIGFILSLVAAGFMLIGLIPFLGWLNWITTLPLAIAGAALSGLGLAGKRRFSFFSLAGLVISVLVFLIACGRLVAGCGIF